MNTLLIVLITLMSITLLVLSWAVIALLIQARRQLPTITQRVEEINARVITLLDETIPTVHSAQKLLDETIPTLHSTQKAIDEAARALHEAAETIENLHIVTDNVRHKLEVADEVGGKIRRLPEKTARFLGRLMHQSFKIGGRIVSRQIQRITESPRPTVYSVRSTNSAQSLDEAIGEPPNRRFAIEAEEEASPVEATHTTTEGGTRDAEPR